MKALLLSKNPEFDARVVDVDEAQLPEGDVTVRVTHSTLNFKDGLAITNRSPVVRQWPMVAGIDGSGEVMESSHPDWKPGDPFILNGWGVGETHWGCLAEKARLKGDWLIRRPHSLSASQAMSFGTAGYTAMLCVMALQEQGVTPDQGEVLVTGATGGVGSVAVALLARLGFRVVAASGKPQSKAYLEALGAREVMDREALTQAGKPLQKERWSGVVDAVGSHTLANALAQTRYGGVVAACGLAQGMDLPTSVMPFILRGVKLMGVDSVMAPLARRQAAWERLAREFDLSLLETMTHAIGLDQAIDHAQALMAGQIQGRVVVNL